MEIEFLGQGRGRHTMRHNETQKRTNCANMLLLILSGYSYFWAEHIEIVPWTQEHCTSIICMTLLVSTHFKSVYSVSSHKKGYLAYYILLIFKTENLNGCYTLTLFVRLGDTQVPIQQQSSTHKNKWPANSTLIFSMGYCVYYVNTNLEIEQINHEHIRSICLTH